MFSTLIFFTSRGSGETAGAGGDRQYAHTGYTVVPHNLIGWKRSRDSNLILFIGWIGKMMTQSPNS